MWQSVEILNVFNTFTLKQISWKAKAFFKKLDYRCLVESTKIENASVPYKTALSEANVKTNRLGNTKWTYQNERSFASNDVIFLKFCFSLRTSYEELFWCTYDSNVYIHTFGKRCSLIWEWFFPVSILKAFCFLIISCIML